MRYSLTLILFKIHYSDCAHPKIRKNGTHYSGVSTIAKSIIMDTLTCKSSIRRNSTSKKVHHSQVSTISESTISKFLCTHYDWSIHYFPVHADPLRCHTPRYVCYLNYCFLRPQVGVGFWRELPLQVEGMCEHGKIKHRPKQC